MKNKIILIVPVALLLLVSCSPSTQSPGKPNILWLVLEDTSPHQFGCYGGKDVSTPEIDNLAANGIRFRAVYPGLQR